MRPPLKITFDTWSSALHAIDGFTHAYRFAGGWAAEFVRDGVSVYLRWNLTKPPTLEVDCPPDQFARAAELGLRVALAARRLSAAVASA
jgi:hypothetical protein